MYEGKLLFAQLMDHLPCTYCVGWWNASAAIGGLRVSAAGNRSEPWRLLNLLTVEACETLQPAFRHSLRSSTIWSFETPYAARHLPMPTKPATRGSGLTSLRA
jgi:hypothetical protein